MLPCLSLPSSNKPGLLADDYIMSRVCCQHKCEHHSYHFALELQDKLPAEEMKDMGDRLGHAFIMSLLHLPVGMPM
jgi:hypothetical protein